MSKEEGNVYTTSPVTSGNASFEERDVGAWERLKRRVALDRGENVNPWSNKGFPLSGLFTYLF